jgi:hypothetical protein
MTMMMPMLMGKMTSIALGTVVEARQLVGPRWSHGSEGCE